MANYFRSLAAACIGLRDRLSLPDGINPFLQGPVAGLDSVLVDHPGHHGRAISKSASTRNALRKTWLAGSLATAGLMSTGCMSTLVHTPEGVAVCRPLDDAGWRSNMRWGAAHWSLQLSTSSYSVQLFDHGSADDVVGPLDDVYWVQVGGSGYEDATGHRPLPVLFDPAEAVVAIGGKEIHALPRAWLQEFADGRLQPLREVVVPVELNAPVPRGRTTPNVFIAFPVHRPGRAANYTLTLGAMLLDGKRTRLPTAGSCHRDSDTHWEPIKC